MTDSVLQSLATLFQKDTSLVGRMTWDAWRAETSERASRVDLYRDYMAGEHRAKLTAEMREMLRLDGPHAVEDVSPFNLNHCDNIVQKLVDRLEVTAIKADTDAGSAWVQSLLDANRFDGLQLTVHDAACGDGDGFLMVGFDEATDMPVFTQEPAYDGVEGMILVYGADGRTPAVAVKVWRENVAENNRLSERARVNVYYADRVEKYVTSNGGALQQHVDKEGDAWPYPWRDGSGQPLGVPVIHFPNGGGLFGRSELTDAIPVQDAINRVMTSMVMSAELTAFQIRIIKGARAPAGISPGMFIELNIPGAKQVGNTVTVDPALAPYLNAMGVEVLETADLAPYLDVQRYMIDQMYEITRTPRAASADSSASGESMKQREVDLIGKAKRCATAFGEKWEAAVRLAARLQNTYGKRSKAPELKTLRANWKDPQIRNDAELVANAVSIAKSGLVDERTMLEMLAPVYGWDDKKLDAIMAAKQEEQTARNASFGVTPFPTFGGAPSTGSSADALAAEIVSVPADLSAQPSANSNGVRAAA